MLVRDVAQALSAQVLGDGSLPIDRIVHPANAHRPSDLAVAMTLESFQALAQSNAHAAIISAKVAAPKDRIKALIIAAQERPALAKLTAMFDDGPVRMPGVHPAAVVAPDAEIGAGVSIGACTTIGPGSKVGPGTVILSNVTVGADVRIGGGGLVYSGARIGDRVVIGERCVIHYNVSIGSDGFSFIPADRETKGRPVKVHALGTVEIGDDVDIGAGTTIARATLEATRIGHGTKIDNLVQIAHNVQIGESCLICGMAGISGSAEIGDRTIVRGGAGVSDHVKIGADANVGPGSGVARNVGAGENVSGYPAFSHERHTEMVLFLSRHKRFVDEIAGLKARLDAFEKAAPKKNERGV